MGGGGEVIDGETRATYGEAGGRHEMDEEKGKQPVPGNSMTNVERKAPGPESSR